MELIRAGTERNQGGHLRWTENASGNFDISSAYKLSMRLNGMEDIDAVGCSDYTQSRKFWKDFWKMPVPRKIKVFGWRGFHEALQTGISLHKRGLDNNVGCVICGYKFETYSHTFLHCWFSKAIWSQLGFSELISLQPAISFADIIHYSWGRFTPKRMRLVLVTLWLIWHNRNKLKHGDKGYNLSDLVYKAKNHTRMFEQYESKFLSSMRFLYNSDFVWKRPPVGFIKINCDASWKEKFGGGLGIVVRDSEGGILGVRAIKGVGSNNSAVCEGMALRESFRMAEQIKAEKVIFETDCAEVVKWLNICPDHTIANDDWFKESLKTLERHMEWKIFLIRREANFVADQLTKLVNEYN